MIKKAESRKPKAESWWSQGLDVDAVAEERRECSYKVSGQAWLGRIGFKSVPIQISLARRKTTQRGAIIGSTLLLMLILVSPAFAVDSVTLIEEPDKYDGKVVTFAGEAIGDVMVRRDGAWININDDAYSRQGRKFKLAGYNSGQGVLVADKQAVKAIKTLGDYNNRGDRVLVRGVFHKACPDHGGDMMIHSDTVKIVKRGFVLDHPISIRKTSLALVWLAFTAAILGLWKWRAVHTRR